MKLPTIKRLESGSYHCQVMVNGKRLSVTEKTRNECLSKAMELISGRLIGLTPHDRKPETLTLRNAMDLYINARSNVLSPSTIRGYKKIRDLRFQSVIDRTVSDISNWQDIINAESQSVSAKTIKNSWGLVKSAIESIGGTVPKVTLPQIIRQEHEFLQPDQITMLLEAIKGEKHELVFLLGLHGLRSSEILGIDAKQNLTENTIRIRGSKVQTETQRGAVKYVYKPTTKNESSRRDVPVMIPRLKDIIKCNSSEDLQKMIPDHPEASRIRLNRICKDNGLPVVGLHGLRHSFASLCYHLGISEAQTMRFGGWNDPAVMRRIYTHLADIDEKKSEAKLKQFFEGK